MRPFRILATSVNSLDSTATLLHSRSIWRLAGTLALGMGMLLCGVETVQAQQADPDGSGPPALKQRVPAPQQGVRGLSYYLRHPSAPIPPAVKQRMPDRMLEQIEQRRERRREGKFEANDQRTPMPKDIGGFPENNPSQSWVLNPTPNAPINFSIFGTPQYAGDVNGDAVNDYVYTDGFARDERTPELEDQTGKTALFYGGAPSETEDQLVYAELRPAGDLNGDGFDDALQIDGTTARIWGGSQNGYADSGVTIDLPFLPYSFPGNGVAGFTDLDGDGSTDALLFDDFGGEEFAVLYGADTFGGVAIQTYQPSTDEFQFAYNVADLDGNGQGSIVRLEGDNFGGGNPMRARIFDFEEGESEIFFKDFQGDQLSPMTVYNVTEGNGWGIGSFEGNVYASANAFGGDEASNSWLITPALNFNAFQGETLTFRNAKLFDDSLETPLQVKVSIDYDGTGNPDNFTWVDVTDRVQSFSGGDANYVSSGEIDLSDEQFQAADVYVAFQYRSSGTGAGSSEEWQVDDIRVVGQGARVLTEVQSFAAEELQGDAGDNQLSLIDITGNDTLEIAAKQRFGTKTYVFERDTDSTYAETPDSLGKDDAVPVGDLDGDGGHDFYTFEESTDTRYVSYGPSDLSEGLTFDTPIPYGDNVLGAAGFLPEGELGDVDDDGRADAVLGYFDNGPSDREVGRRFVSVDEGGNIQTDEVTYPRAAHYDDIDATEEIGDFNNDGTVDFAIVRNGFSRIDIFYGGSSVSQTPDLTIDAPTTGYYFTVASGDFNGDETSDIAVGYQGGEQIELYFGGNSPDATLDHVYNPDDAAFDQYYYPRTIGDVNDNGADDLVATDNTFSDSANVVVFFGGTLSDTPDQTLEYQENAGEAGVNSVALGDLNDDNHDDFAVARPDYNNGSSSAEGRVDVYYGGDSPTFSASNPDLVLRPEVLDDNIDGFGSALAAGDFDGDGIGDVAVRPERVDPESNTGNVTISVFYGGPDVDASVDQRLDIPSETGIGRDSDDDGYVNETFGPLESVGDVDGDNTADLVMGSSDFTGTNALLYGPNIDTEPTQVLRAPNQDSDMGDGAGSPIAVADFTDDGRTDIVISQESDNNDGLLSSRVYRYEVSSIPVASATVDVEENGEKPFEGTGLAINFSNISGEDDVVATKYLNPPVNAGTINEESTAVRYTVETGDGLTFGAGTAAQFSTTSPPLDGLENPGDVVVYHREVPGTGTFEALETTYDAEADEIVAPIESFGELVLTTTAGPVTVWPGDTNNDGVVDQADVLPLGIYWGSSGPARSETGCSWEGQSADSWSPAAATYADADGDGTVDQADVLCLGLNWGRSHSTSSESLVATSRSAQEPAGRLALRLGERSGSTVWVNIHAEGISSLRGVAAELSFAPEKVSVATVESGRRMGDAALLQSNTNETEGTLGLGISRKSGSSSAGDADEAVARVKLRTDVRRPELSARDVRASTVEGTTVPLATGDGLQNLPDEVTLSAPAPNPVRQHTTLRYALPEAQSIRLSVYDVMGREVAVLIDQRQNPGRKQVRLDASQLSSGTYFYRLRAGETTKTKRLTVVR